MSSLRIARAALRVRPTAVARPLQRRGYAEVASDKLKLSLSLPYQVRTPGPPRNGRAAFSRATSGKRLVGMGTQANSVVAQSLFKSQDVYVSRLPGCGREARVC